jgi:hypothetical protein
LFGVKRREVTSALIPTVQGAELHS